MFDGFNRTGMVSTGSRVAFDRPWTLSQRLWLVANEYRTFNRAGQRLDTGTENELGYRADVTAMPFPAASVTAGASVQRVRSDGRVYLYDTPAAGRITLDAYTGARWISSAHVQLRVAHRTTTVTSGARVDWWTPIGRVAASPWVQLDARVARWRLAAGGGIYRQPPTVEVVDGPRGTHDLREEHAWHAEIGIEREISTHVRWRATTYDREERDGLRLPDSEDRLDESGRLIRRSTTTRWQQPLEGSARGVELLLQRSALDGLSGWVAYTYGRARYHDRSTGETFDANADQRHTLNLQASYRFGSRTSFGVKFRAGSNIPVAGYYRQEGDQFFLAAERNTLRLPHYSRLDLRAARTFAAGSRRLTLFVEVLNVYNRRNYGPQGVNVNRRTLEATGLVEELLPILPSAGLSIEF
jgi:hypothetical protein